MTTLRLEDDGSENSASSGIFLVDRNQPRRGSSSRNSDDKLGTLLLAAIVFYNVSGGPFGIEASVRSAGALYTLLGFLIMPLVWSVPEAIVTAELGSTFPEPAGGVAWVEEAFGEQAAWISGYLGWVAGATDNAIYPVLFLDYLVQVFFPASDNLFGAATWSRFVFVSLTTVVLGYINWRGLRIVGKLSVAVAFIALSPFVILVAVGIFRIEPRRWLQLPVPSGVDNNDETQGGFFPSLSLGGIMLRPFLNNLFWNLNSFDAAASFGGDVTNTATTFPRAMGLSVLFVALGYFVPLLVVIGALDTPPDAWVDGYIAIAASRIVGPWLGVWTVFAAGVSNIALFQAELSADSFQIMGMADRGYLPRIFSERSQYGTPTYGILLGLAVIATVLTVSNLDQLIEMLNFSYSISLIMEYAAFLELRRSKPDLERPWRFPFGLAGCVMLLAMPLAFTLFTMALATFNTLFSSIFVVIFGILLYTLRKCWKTLSYDQVATHAAEQDNTGSDITGENDARRTLALDSVQDGTG